MTYKEFQEKLRYKASEIILEGYSARKKIVADKSINRMVKCFNGCDKFAGLNMSISPDTGCGYFGQVWINDVYITCFRCHEWSTKASPMDIDDCMLIEEYGDLELHKAIKAVSNQVCRNRIENLGKKKARLEAEISGIDEEIQSLICKIAS